MWTLAAAAFIAIFFSPRPIPVIAPVIERSGKSLWVHRRLSRPIFISQTFHEFAQQSTRFSSWADQFYRRQRARGKSHHSAIRALAFKWIRIIYACGTAHYAHRRARYHKFVVVRWLKGNCDRVVLKIRQHFADRTDGHVHFARGRFGERLQDYSESLARSLRHCSAGKPRIRRLTMRHKVSTLLFVIGQPDNVLG